MQKRKHYTAEQKAKILRELLENKVPISQLCEQYEVRLMISIIGKRNYLNQRLIFSDLKTTRSRANHPNKRK